MANRDVAELADAPPMLPRGSARWLRRTLLLD